MGTKEYFICLLSVVHIFVLGAFGCERKERQEVTILQDNFGSQTLSKEWEIKGSAQLNTKLSEGILEISGDIVGQEAEKSNYVMLSKPVIKSPSEYEISIRISFSGAPDRRLSPREEYKITGGGSVIRKEGEKEEIRRTELMEISLRPPAAYFGIADMNVGKSLMFRIEPREVYIMGSVAGYEKKRGSIFEKISDIEEGKWYNYRIVYDGKEQKAELYINDELLFSTVPGSLGMNDVSVFFGVSGEEGIGVKTVNFARFDNVLIVKK